MKERHRLWYISWDCYEREMTEISKHVRLSPCRKGIPYLLIIDCYHPDLAGWEISINNVIPGHRDARMSNKARVNDASKRASKAQSAIASRWSRDVYVYTHAFLSCMQPRPGTRGRTASWGSRIISKCPSGSLVSPHRHLFEDIHGDQPS